MLMNKDEQSSEFLKVRSLVEQSIQKLQAAMKLMDIATHDYLQSLESFSVFYPKTGSWRSKILFAIEDMTEAGPKEIADYIVNIEEKYNLPDKPSKEKALNIVGQYLPTMYKEGSVFRRKEGRMYVYKVSNPMIHS